MVFFFLPMTSTFATVLERKLRRIATTPVAICSALKPRGTLFVPM